MSIITPGSPNLSRVRANSPFNRPPPIGNDDRIIFALESIHSPVVKFIPPTGIAIPKPRGNFSDLQLDIVGKRTSDPGFVCNRANPIFGRDTANNCFYTLSSARLSMDAIAIASFVESKNLLDVDELSTS